MNINKKSRKSLVGPASCMALLVLLAVATMCPVSSRARVNATDGSGSSSADTADTEDTLPTEESGAMKLPLFLMKILTHLPVQRLQRHSPSHLVAH